MLPDFPTEKAHLLKYCNQYLDYRIKTHLGFFANTPSFLIYEGEETTLLRADGSVGNMDFRTVESEFQLRKDEIPYLTMDEIRKLLDRMAEQIAEQMSKGMFETLNRELQEAGQVIDAQGKTFNRELFLDLLEKSYVEFDKKGNPILPTIVIHPDMWEVVQRELTAAEDDTNFKLRYEKIIIRKRDEWLARESRRKLVD